MARCEFGKYHVDAEFCLVEAVPIDPAQPRVCRLIFTGFANPAMPFIRYDVGDYGLLSEEPCRCGRASLTFDRIEGRTEDFVRTRDGRLVVGMNQALEWAPNLVEAQIRQESIDRLMVLVVPGAAYGGEDEKILERQIRLRVGNDMAIEFRQVASIPRAANGKFRAVVSVLGGETAEEASLQRAVREGVFDD